MTTNTTTESAREGCPVTGRSASACSDQNHATCSVGHLAAVALDRKIQAALR